ncbi:sensor histidine kinase [Paenibacillus antri]|uniref:histidine kinase n=1 Tax=Paenibacillus antri TaxID=2582848 RepID=A0A5R9G874_9BACL|nr:sensor histidine kinase [Paenibacillus antri]TLS49244.1 sensor histidine kinase [Paenibacillus antri]
MSKWSQFFIKNTGLGPYVWVVFYILPFYFIFRSSSPYEIALGIGLILLFFACYVMAFVSKKGWLVFFWTSVQILVSIVMTVLFGYVYFSLFLAFFIGNLQNRVAFFTFYTIHLISTIVTVNVGFATKNPVFITQLPFVLVCLIGVVLLPVSTYNKNRQDKLEGQLENANKRISELVKLEERQRIARDLHDTLGQKLSLIGLKTDLAGKLIDLDARQARAELDDIRQTARTALKEVREMVTSMRGDRVEDELYRVRQILKAAEIELRLEGDPTHLDTSLMIENVLSMCLKEAVTNVVRHSKASVCTIAFRPSRTELVLRVSDNGVGIAKNTVRGNGLRGMRERLEFVNGSFDIESVHGTTVVIRVPNMPKPPEKEEIRA